MIREELGATKVESSRDTYGNKSEIIIFEEACLLLRIKSQVKTSDVPQGLLTT